MNNRRIRPLIVAVILLVILGSFSGCNQKEEQIFTSVTQLNDQSYRIGLFPTTTAATITRTELPEATYQYFNSYPDGLLAVQTGKLDALSFDRDLMNYSIANGLTGVKLLPENLGELSEIGIGVSRQSKIPNLEEKINNALKQLRDDGILDEMFERWVIKAESSIPDIPKPENPTMTLKVGTSGLAPPFTYFEGDKLIGYDLELAERLGLALNAKIEIRTYDYSGFPAAVEAGAIDCVLANLNATEENRTVMDFSTPVYHSKTALLVRDENASVIQGSFLTKLKESFIRTFVTENRWKLIIDGLLITIIISIGSGIFGSLLGFGMCILRRSKCRVISRLVAAFIRAIQGTPIIVLMMILYYIVFGKIDISAIFVAIISFGINFGVYASEIMRSGIEAVDVGQIEAAYAIGYSKLQAFRKIIFPQAAHHFLPVFKGEFISMVKMTSVVGYIAVQDLTKVSDIIRSRTMEAFFPLIVTALLYFLVANLLTLLLSCVEVRLDPKRRKRTVKGVIMK